MPSRTIAEVIAEHAPRLLAIEGVVGVYEGQREADGTPCIKVAIARHSTAHVEEIPNHLEGHPVVVVETGPIEPK